MIFSLKKEFIGKRETTKKINHSVQSVILKVKQSHCKNIGTDMLRHNLPGCAQIKVVTPFTIHGIIKNQTLLHLSFKMPDSGFEMQTDFVELVLTCGSWQEAQRIVDALLEQRLIACAEFMEVKSKYHWQGKLEENKEIKLVMETVADNFKKVEAEVAKLHSYETFVLQQIPLTNLSAKAQVWLRQEVND